MDRLDPPSVTADWAEDDLMAIKIQTGQLELNVYVTRPELGQIEQVRSTDARNHRTHRMGTILEATAWWCIDLEADVVHILGGHDDETWDVGATLPLATLEAILAEVSTAVARG